MVSNQLAISPPRKEDRTVNLPCSKEKTDYEKCIRHLQSLLLSDPTNEEAHRMIMLSYALLGSRSAAIRQFKVCEDNLKKYLDIEPEPETVNLHKKIKHGNPKDYRKLLNLVG